MTKPVVKFSNVTKEYNLFKKKSDQLLDMFAFKRNNKKFSALRGISFEVYRGETIGIIGTNGSGKSTLSNLLAQVVPPTSGDVQIDGQTSLVAISAGLNNHLTGYENIELKCLMHGLNKTQIAEIAPDIIDFADIGEFINQPIKNYSSGMKSRLGFAISVHIEPDILIVDEALSVGDSTFHQKCVDKFKEFKEQGKTIFFISHSLSQVKTISDRILWVSYGQMKMFDTTAKVAKEYTTYIKWFNELTKQEKKNHKNEMLGTQFGSPVAQTDEPISQKRSSKKKNVKKPSFLPIVVMLILTIATSTSMFFNNPMETVFGKWNDRGSASEADPERGAPSSEDEQEERTLDEEGLSFDQVTLFETKKLSGVSHTIPMNTEVHVLSESDDTYKLEFQGDTYYAMRNKLGVIEQKGSSSSIVLDDLSNSFSSGFAQSYEYFFAFSTSNYDEIKATFNGLTGEQQLSNGQELLEYSDDNLSFLFQEDGSVEAIIVSSINLNSTSIEDLKKNAQAVSNDEEGYYLQLEQYDVLLDEENRTLAFYPSTL